LIRNPEEVGKNIVSVWIPVFTGMTTFRDLLEKVLVNIKGVLASTPFYVNKFTT